MAHTVCGIDLGAYSIKLAFLEAGFRATTLRGLEEIPVPAGEAPLIERQLAAVREGLARVPGEVTPYLAVAGDQLSVRVLELPFTDARKIDQVVGYELEGQIVNAIEDVVFDHLVAAEKPEGTTILAAAAKREDLAAFIAAAETQGIHPRSLFAAPVIYRTLFPAMASVGDETPAAANDQQRVDLQLGAGGEAGQRLPQLADGGGERLPQHGVELDQEGRARHLPRAGDEGFAALGLLGPRRVGVERLGNRGGQMRAAPPNGARVDRVSAADDADVGPLVAEVEHGLAGAGPLVADRRHGREQLPVDDRRREQ